MTSSPPSRSFRFVDRDPDSYPRPELNPFMRLHRSFGPPVVTATQAQQAMGRWDQIFERAAPLHVEIGSGNGFWITHMAGLHPEHNWLGVEIRFKRVVLVARKPRREGTLLALTPMIYAPIRLVWDALRNTDLGGQSQDIRYVFGLTPGQIAAVILFGLGAWCFWMSRKRPLWPTPDDKPWAEPVRAEK